MMFLILVLLGIVKWLKLKGSFLLLLGITLGMLSMFNSLWHINHDMTDSSAVFRGTVQSIKSYDDYSRIIVKRVTGVEGRSFGGVQIITSDSVEDRFESGDVIVFDGQLEHFEGMRNLGGFDQRQYHYGQGVYYKMRCNAMTLDHANTNSELVYKNINTLLGKLRAYIESAIDRLFDDDKNQLVKAILLGDDDLISDDVRNVLKETGLSHILALSGLHLSIIVLGLYKCIRGLIRPYGELATIGIMVIYVLLTGAQVSTVRAGWMLTVYLIGISIHKRYDPLSGLLVTMLIMMLLQPFIVFQVGFQLSVSAVIGIIILGPFISQKIQSMSKIDQGHTLRKRILQLVSPLAGITLMTTPLVINHFNGISLVSIPANLILVPLLPMIILLSILAVFCLVWMPGLAVVFAMAVSVLSDIMFLIARWFCSLPGHYLHVGKIPLMLTIGYYLVLILWCYRVPEIKGFIQKRIMRVSVILMVVYWIVLSGISWNRLQIIHLDVGQGDACLIRYRGHQFMVDTGGEVMRYGEVNIGLSVILKHLRQEGITFLDGVFITHSDFDHLYGLIELMPYVDIGAIYLPRPYERYEDALLLMLYEQAEIYGIDVCYIDADFEMAIGDLSIRCLYPFDDTVYDDNNNHSLVLYIRRQYFDCLLTGDITAEIENSLLEMYDIDAVEVLKVAHHGSSSSSTEAFITATSPQVSVISVSKSNLYGHPSYITVSTLTDNDSHIYETKDFGAVSIYYDGFMVYYMDSMLKKGRERYTCN